MEPDAKRPRLDNDDELERKRKERADKFKRLKEARKLQSAPPIDGSQAVLSVQGRALVSNAVVKIALNRTSPIRTTNRPLLAPIFASDSGGGGLSFLPKESQQTEQQSQQPSMSDNDDPPSSTRLDDTLETYMEGIGKQMEKDILETLNKLNAKHIRDSSKRKPPAKLSITFDEINYAEEDSASSPPTQDVKEFMAALAAHEKEKQPPPVAPSTQNKRDEPSNRRDDPQIRRDDAQIRRDDAQMRRQEAERYGYDEGDFGGEEDFSVLALTNEPHNGQILLGVDDDENQQGAVDDYLNNQGEPEESYFELLAKHGSKKELQQVNHDEIDYEPFTKNLYIQAREISQMKDHEVDALRRTHGHIRVRGKGCPRPVREFTHCGLSDGLLRTLQQKGCDKPFPIQMQAIPALMCGRNVIGVAETGSGKTLAYLLPLLRHVCAQRPLKEGEGPIALIIGPTRELIQQIASEARKFCAAVKVRCALVYGGGGIGAQLSELKRGAEIVCGTPGRLTEVLTINRGRLCNLKRVTFLVLDEADRMFDLGFGPQVERIMSNVRPDAQRALFSATFPSHIENLARKTLYKPLEIIVGDKNRPASTVSQHVEILSDYDAKILRLLKLLGEWYDHGESILIFVKRQSDADDLCLQLSKYGYDALTLHGGQDQEDRELAIYDFKKKLKTVLISTSLAARGLDVRSVVLVINFNPPDHLEDYVHRIGRTGRAGSVGVAYTFLTPEDADKAEDILRALNESEQEVPQALVDLVTQHQATAGATRPKHSGFRGRGFKFTPIEKSAQQEARSAWKKELGIGAEEEEDELNQTDSESVTSPPPSAQTVPTNTPAPAPATTTAQAPMENAMIQEIHNQAVALIDKWTAAILDPVQKQHQVDALLPVIKQIISQQHSSASLGGGLSPMVHNALQPLKAAMPTAAPTTVAKAPRLAADYVDSATNNYISLLSINDYPPQARYKVSHRDTLSRIAELTGTVLQVRGVYIDNKKKQPNTPAALTAFGSKELHIEIIAPTQVAAQKARRELHLILETVAKRQLNR